MNDRKKLAKLSKLSGLRYRTAQAEMAALLLREEGLRKNHAQLTQSKQSQALAHRGPDDAALAAGADIRWRQWVDQRRTTINSELAQLLAQKEGCRQTLKMEFGRDQAVIGLQEHHERLLKRRLRRKENYES